MFMAFAAVNSHPARYKYRFQPALHELPKLLNESLLPILEHSSDGIAVVDLVKTR